MPGIARGMLFSGRAGACRAVCLFRCGGDAAAACLYVLGNAGYADVYRHVPGLALARPFHAFGGHFRHDVVAPFHAAVVVFAAQDGLVFLFGHLEGARGAVGVHAARVLVHLEGVLLAVEGDVYVGICRRGADGLAFPFGQTPCPVQGDVVHFLVCRGVCLVVRRWGACRPLSI